MKLYALLPATLLLAACATTPGYLTTYPLVEHPSTNANGRVRFLVMHYTSSNFASSLQTLSEPSDDGDDVSAHYLLPEEGDPSYGERALKVYQLVPENRRAWHAGLSRWENRQNLNDQSIGIEIVNRARCHAVEGTEPLCFFPDFSTTQLQLLLKLSQDILVRNPDITPTSVVGHSDIAPTRKTDPGPRFPWQWLAQHGVGAWYEDDTVLKHYRAVQGNTDNIALLQRALRAYGYDIKDDGASDADMASYIRAFQMHFRPWEINGQATATTTATALALVEKYYPTKLPQVLQPTTP
ncbi:N-acetylmuramoyl-L-alanine amidase [Chitinimonas sp. BJB300]|uniref:N-acetylmuramoyl-L-alanine amidase n=1 Tax=Chitinimonas sp. BJB300 TaxID=1559339 RepID=UPI000C115A8E|nr:N-acetylmuramoyl-L-alanine amidase [Chitinimonas sp. BJB300]PHV12529.1 N-acetylmuramoyl-L-alanine amidase [Chitinimonas sp. BJB300]TSJ91121.1 N-acetylmuramoyl-L-alanine amidase [Chitinimonas sp. BJB300]